MAEDYIGKLDAERDQHIPPFAHPEDVTRDPNPEKPRNWPMSGEKFIADETRKARRAVEQALDSRPEYVDASKKLEEAKKDPRYVERQWNGVVVFQLGNTVIQVEQDRSSLRIVTANATDALPAIEKARKYHGDVGRSIGGSSYAGPEDYYEYPVAEFIDIKQYVEGNPINGLKYMGPNVFKVPKEGELGYGENIRDGQSNTTAAKDGIMDFARRLRTGNLEIPNQQPSNQSSPPDSGTSTPPAASTF